MSNKIFWFTILHNLKIIISLIIIAVLAGYIFTITRPTSYEASTLLILHKKPEPQEKRTDFYQYDNYYAIQAAGLEADNLSVIIASPSAVKEIYEKAEISLPVIALKKLAKTFKTKKVLAINVLDIFIEKPSEQEAKLLVKTAAEVLREKTDPKFNVEISEPIAKKVKGNLTLNTVVAGLIGLIVALLFVFGRGNDEAKKSR